MYQLHRERGPWLTECDSDRNAKGGGKRPLVVTVEPRGVRLRPKGCRSGEVFVTWSTINLRGQAAAAGFDTGARGKGATKRQATVALVQQLYTALATLRYGMNVDTVKQADAAILAAEQSGLVKQTTRRAIINLGEKQQ